MSEDQVFERAKILYLETTKLTATFVDWREKVLVRFFLVQAGCIGAAGWVYQQPLLHRWVFLPFALASIFALFSAVLDRVNTKLLHECCYPVGQRLERAILEGGGVLTAIQSSNRFWSYKVTLRILYLCAAALSLTCSAASVFLV